MASETLVYTPEASQANSYLPWMLANQNNGFFGGAGGSAFWGALFGSVLPGLFGGWGNGFNGIGGGNGAAAAIGAQATANSNMETILRAVDGTDADIRLVASNLNSDINSVKSDLSTLQNGITMLSGMTGLSTEQIKNAIQTGNATIASQLCQCCCEAKQLVISQGYENQLATLRQTDSINGSIADLKATVIDQFCQAEKRDMQAEIDRKAETITQLRGQIDNANQTATITGYINSLVSPLAKEVDDIKCKLPNTVSVTYPNLYAVNATPYVSGGYYQGGFNGIYGYPGIGGFGGGLNF